MLVDPVGEGVLIGEALATAEMAQEEATTATQEANAAAVAGLAGDAMLAEQLAEVRADLARLGEAFVMLVDNLSVEAEVLAEVAEDAADAQDTAEQALEVASVAEEVSETDADIVAEVVAEEGLSEDAGGSEPVPGDAGATGDEPTDEAPTRADSSRGSSRSRFRRGGRR